MQYSVYCSTTSDLALAVVHAEVLNLNVGVYRDNQYL